jgi:zinc/manganese transport system substrate-binding protein
MNKKSLALVMGLSIISTVIAACHAPVRPQNSQKTIVVTYSILGAVVKDLVGDKANVIVSMPNGQDPHEWEPSAKDIEKLTKADMIVENGLGLEGGMEKALGQAKEAGVEFFTASKHIIIRKVGVGEGIPGGDPDQAIGAEDPHLWTDPASMIRIVDALTAQIHQDLGIDLTERASDLDARLLGLDKEIKDAMNSIPPSERKLVTGHESMGYYAERYDLKLVGAIIPSITTQAEASASDMAYLKKLIAENQVKAIFTELGTPKAISDAIGNETGAKVVELATHVLPEDGSYFTFMRNLTMAIINGLK